MGKLRAFSGLVLMTAFWGCIREVDIGTGNQAPQIVLNCFLDTKEDTVTARLTYSSAIQSTARFDAITGAKIRLFSEGESVGEFMWIDSSAYLLPHSVAPGKTYRIEANVENKTVWAETTVPNSIDADIAVANPDDYIFYYVIRLNDNKNEENFYWVTTTNIKEAGSNKPVEIVSDLYSNFEYADNFNQRIQSYDDYFKFQYEYYMRFADSGLPEKITEVMFYPVGFGKNANVFLLSVDYHLDKYMKSSLMLERMDLYAEENPIIYSPFPMYSNINGGTGIFGSFNSVSKVFTKTTNP
jgi:hypothetical protein